MFFAIPNYALAEEYDSVKDRVAVLVKNTK